MKELLVVTAVTVTGDVVKVEDGLIVTSTNGIYEVLVADGTYKAMAAPKLGETVVSLTGDLTKAADVDIAPITKDLKVHANDLPKSEAKAFIAKLGHTKLADAELTEEEFMSAMAHKILHDDEIMEGAVDAAMESMPEGSGETRESIREKIKEEAVAQLAEPVDSPYTTTLTSAFKK